MKRLYLDCEFNGFAGELISMALVDGDDVAFYAGCAPSEPIVPWVQENVMPVLYSSFLPWQGYTPNALANSLVAFLAHQSRRDGWVGIVADHPADFVHLNKLLDIWSSLNDFASLKFNIDMNLVRSGELQSAVPHNALEDALALRNWCKDNGL